MIRKFLIITVTLLLNVCMAMASDFDFIFSDSTLRIDYIFSGNADVQMISVKELKKSPHWAGRRTNLQSVPLDGNGDITIYDATTNDILYKNSFSSLFQEWLSTPEATETNRSFEFTLLIPKPHRQAVAEVVLRKNRNEATATLRHTIMPNDVLIKDISAQKPEPYKYLHKAGNPNECIDIAIVAEGYTKKEMKHFLKDAQTAADEILSYEPFSRYADKINFVAVMCPSIDTDVSTPQDNSWKQTAINSNFMTFYSPRYLTTNSIHTLHDRLANIPYEHIIVLANTDTYGGGGIYNSLTLTTAHHASFKPVVVHEFGHSFGGLADEYFYESGDVLDATYSLNHEPWEANLTTLVDFNSKWADMMPDGIERPTKPTDERKANYTVGLYEGGGYQTKGIYRPAVVCRMRDNASERFCPVCERNLERVILHHLIPQK